MWLLQEYTDRKGCGKSSTHVTFLLGSFQPASLRSVDNIESVDDVEPPEQQQFRSELSMLPGFCTVHGKSTAAAPVTDTENLGRIRNTSCSREMSRNLEHHSVFVDH